MPNIIIPASPILKKYIVCFYTYTGSDSSIFRYIAFPHVNTSLSFFKGASVKRSRWHVKIAESNTAEINIEVLGKFVCPVMIEYQGALQEISIVFKPLGICQFFKENYLDIAPEFSQGLVDREWLEFGKNLFRGDHDLSTLESFLLSRITAHQDLAPLEKSLEILADVNDASTISAIAVRAGYTLKTFQRHFKKHLGCSPVEYRRICRFRNAIASRLNQRHIKSLTAITYENGYFDQSHFIKEFKRLTGHNPKDFFRATNKTNGAPLIWEIL